MAFLEDGMVGLSFGVVFVGIVDALAHPVAWATSILATPERGLVFAPLYVLLFLLIVQQYRRARRRGWDRF